VLAAALTTCCIRS